MNDKNLAREFTPEVTNHTPPMELKEAETISFEDCCNYVSKWTEHQDDLKEKYINKNEE